MENMSEESAGEGETSQVQLKCSACLSVYLVVFILFVVVLNVVVIVLLIVVVVVVCCFYELVVLEEREIVKAFLTK